MALTKISDTFCIDLLSIHLINPYTIKIRPPLYGSACFDYGSATRYGVELVFKDGRTMDMNISNYDYDAIRKYLDRHF